MITDIGWNEAEVCRILYFQTNNLNDYSMSYEYKPYSIELANIQILPPALMSKLQIKIEKTEYQRVPILQITSCMQDSAQQCWYKHKYKQRYKQSGSRLQANIIIGTLILIIFGTSLYAYAIMLINSYEVGGSEMISYRYSQRNKLVAGLQMVQEGNWMGRRETGGGIGNKDDMILPVRWIQQIKKVSSQISEHKLARANNFLLNLSAPISPSQIEDQKNQYQRDYQISKYAEKPFCIVVPTYNNVQKQRYKHNIDSILSQQYKNYRVIMIDDASTDGTGKAIQEHIKEKWSQLVDKVHVKINTKRKMALQNILFAARNFCNPDDIFMVVDGDDTLLGKYAFKLFNAAYSNSDAWVVYSNFLTVNGKVGYSRRYPTQIIQQNMFRRVLFIVSHLRTFYTKLLLLVKKQDLLDSKGQYFHAANDLSIFIPILQMSRDHILYLPEINYYYNSNTGLNNHLDKKMEQIKNDQYIRRKKPYKKIDVLFD